jgi:hypothetical protein
MLRSILSITLSYCILTVVSGQRMIQKHSQTDYILQRTEIKSDLASDWSSALRNHQEMEVVRYASNLMESDSLLSINDLTDIHYILKDHYPKLCTFPDSLYYKNRPWFNHFYRKQSKLFAYSQDEIHLEINPLLAFELDYDLKKGQSYFRNTRGLILAGKIKGGFTFYSSLIENQRSFPSYLERGIETRKAIPGQGFFKPYQSSLHENIQGYDYLNAQAYIHAQLTKGIGLSFGHSDFFIGNGIRSLLLSDYGPNYLFLKVDYSLGRLHYQNLFTEMTSTSSAEIGADVLLPKKYMAAHYLSFQLTGNLEFGFFESVIFRRENGFELQYLNPVILYRSAEYFVGSPDNLLIGLNARWDLFHRLRLYGQFTLDEFKLAEFFNGDGWWGNKFGYQLGIQYIDVAGIDHLDLQLETNLVRPYTYSHQDSLISYSHYNQALAHPLGANFREYIIKLRYQPVFPLLLELEYLHAGKGVDVGYDNYGGNILLSADSRVGEYNIVPLQGNLLTIDQLRFRFSWSFYHNYALDLNLLYRREKMGDEKDDYFIIGSGLRINMAADQLDY